MKKVRAYEIAMDALEEWRVKPFAELSRLAGSIEKTTIAGPDGETYYLDVRVDWLEKRDGFRVVAIVDQGSSFKLERIEEAIEIAGA